jgi:hypothetical protein
VVSDSDYVRSNNPKMPHLCMWPSLLRLDVAAKVLHGQMPQGFVPLHDKLTCDHSESVKVPSALCR